MVDIVERKPPQILDPFKNKRELILKHHTEFWAQDEAPADVYAYASKKQNHRYSTKQEKWLQEMTVFQLERLIASNSAILASNDTVSVIGNLRSFDTVQYQESPKDAGMSFIHLLGIPKEQIFNGVSLTHGNYHIIDDVISLFESSWGDSGINDFRRKVVQHQREAIEKNKQSQLKALDKHGCKEDEIEARARKAMDHFDELEGIALKAKVDSFRYGLHLWPTHTVGHLHVHIVACLSELRCYSTNVHDKKTIDAGEMRDFVKGVSPEHISNQVGNLMGCMTEEISGVNNNENEEYEGWVEETSQPKKILLRYGPPSSAKYRIKAEREIVTAFTPGETRNLALNRPGEELEHAGGRFVIPEGSIVEILGVGWEYAEEEEEPIALLNPNNWEQREHGKAKPYTLVKVKLRVLSDDHIKEKYIVSWETRATVQRIWGNEEINLENSLELDGNILLHKSQAIGRADAAIMIAAQRCEIRYREFLCKNETASD